MVSRYNILDENLFKSKKTFIRGSNTVFGNNIGFSHNLYYRSTYVFLIK